MEVHLVVAHPDQNSFNLALHRIALETFRNEKYKVNVSDLYEQNFNPVAGKSDTTSFPSGESFQLAKAQRLALANKPQIGLSHDHGISLYVS